MATRFILLGKAKEMHLFDIILVFFLKEHRADVKTCRDVLLWLVWKVIVVIERAFKAVEGAGDDWRIASIIEQVISGYFLRLSSACQVGTHFSAVSCPFGLVQLLFSGFLSVMRFRLSK